MSQPGVLAFHSSHEDRLLLLYRLWVLWVLDALEPGEPRIKSL